MDVAEMSRGSRVAAAGSVISTVAISALLLLAFAPGAWWIVTIYGWVVFPALGLLGRDTSRISRGNFAEVSAGIPKVSDEKKLLEALGREGELTAVRAAILTPLSVEASEKILRELAEEGHLQVRVREGGIFYAMWESREELELR